MTLRLDTFAHLSTGHLTDAVRAAMTSPQGSQGWVDRLSIMEREYGWFIHVPVIEDDEDIDPDLPECLAACFALARQHNASWILFDCDEDQIDDLPWYAD